MEIEKTRTDLLIGGWRISRPSGGDADEAVSQKDPSVVFQGDSLAHIAAQKMETLLKRNDEKSHGTSHLRNKPVPGSVFLVTSEGILVMADVLRSNGLPAFEQDTPIRTFCKAYQVEDGLYIEEAPVDHNAVFTNPDHNHMVFVKAQVNLMDPLFPAKDGKIPAAYAKAVLQPLNPSVYFRTIDKDLDDFLARTMGNAKFFKSILEKSRNAWKGKAAPEDEVTLREWITTGILHEYSHILLYALPEEDIPESEQARLSQVTFAKYLELLFTDKSMHSGVAFYKNLIKALRAVKNETPSEMSKDNMLRVLGVEMFCDRFGMYLYENSVKNVLYMNVFPEECGDPLPFSLVEAAEIARRENRLGEYLPKRGVNLPERQLAELQQNLQEAESSHVYISKYGDVKVTDKERAFFKTFLALLQDYDRKGSIGRFSQKHYETSTTIKVAESGLISRAFLGSETTIDLGAGESARLAGQVSTQRQPKVIAAILAGVALITGLLWADFSEMILNLTLGFQTHLVAMWQSTLTVMSYALVLLPDSVPHLSVPHHQLAGQLTTMVMFLGFLWEREQEYVDPDSIMSKTPESEGTSWERLRAEAAVPVLEEEERKTKGEPYGPNDARPAVGAFALLDNKKIARSLDKLILNGLPQFANRIKFGFTKHEQPIYQNPVHVNHCGISSDFILTGYKNGYVQAAFRVVIQDTCYTDVVEGQQRPRYGQVPQPVIEGQQNVMDADVFFRSAAECLKKIFPRVSPEKRRRYMEELATLAHKAASNKAHKTLDQLVLLLEKWLLHEYTHALATHLSDRVVPENLKAVTHDVYAKILSNQKMRDSIYAKNLIKAVMDAENLPDGPDLDSKIEIVLLNEMLCDRFAMFLDENAAKIDAYQKIFRSKYGQPMSTNAMYSLEEERKAGTLRQNHPELHDNARCEALMRELKQAEDEDIYVASYGAARLDDIEGERIFCQMFLQWCRRLDLTNSLLTYQRDHAKTSRIFLNSIPSLFEHWVKRL